MKYFSKNEITIIPESEIDKLVESKETDKFLMIFPTNRNVYFEQKNVAKRFKNTTLPELNYFSFSEYLIKLYTTKFPEKRQINSSLQFVLIKNIVNDNKLKFFQRLREYPSSGMIELLINSILKFKETGLYLNEIKKEMSLTTNQYNKLKLEDIFLVYSLYQIRLKELNLFDIGDIYEYFSILPKESWNSIIKPVFGSVRLIYLKGFSHFSNPELCILDKLLATSDCQIVINLDFDITNQKLYSNLIDLSNKLLKLGYIQLNSESTEDREFNDLFKDKRIENRKKSKINIFIGSSSEEIDEITNIGKFIKYKIFHDKEFCLSKTCLLLQNINTYSEKIRGVFDEYEIPVNITHRFELKDSYLFTELLTLLKLEIYNYNVEDLVILSSSILPCLRVDDALDFRNILIESEIKYGLNNYFEYLKSEYERISYKLSIIEDDDSLKILFISQLSSIKNAENYLKKIDKLLFPFRKNLTTKEFIERFHLLMHELKIEDYVLKINNYFSNNEDIKIIAKEISAFNCIFEILNELEDIHQTINLLKDYELEYYYEYINNAALGTRFNISKKISDGLLITTPDEARNLNFDYVFILSLNNGNFPGKFKPLLYFEEKYDDERITHTLNERYLFYQSLKIANKEIYLSYVERDDKKILQKSDFLEELINAYECNKLSFPDSEIMKFSETEIIEMDLEIEDIKYKKSKEKFNQKKAIYRKRNAENLSDIYHGLLQKEYNLEELRKIISRNGFSLTQLDKMKNCRFSFFLDRILKLREENASEELHSRKSIGNILHQSLKKYFQILISQDYSMKRKIQEGKETVITDLKEIILSEINLSEKYNPLKFLIMDSFFTKINGKDLIELYIDAEEELYDSKTSKSGMSTLGVEKKVKKVISDLGQELMIYGKIDRIDYDRENNTVQIIDYKAKKSSGEVLIKRTGKYNSWQLPFYLLCMIEELKMEEHQIKESNTQYFFIYQDGYESEAKTKKLKPSEQLQLPKYIKEFETELNELLHLVLKGDFSSLAKDKKICQYCGFKQICST